MSDTDVKSYQNRIWDAKRDAREALIMDDYDKLLQAAGKLIALKQGLYEVFYQQEVAKRCTK